MKKQTLLPKFTYAGRGLVYLWRHERSFRWQVAAALGAQAVAWYLSLDPVSWALITVVSFVVLSAEAFNTVLERLFDLVEPRLSAQVGVLKNLLAAAVLLVAVGAVAVALFVFVSGRP